MLCLRPNTTTAIPRAVLQAGVYGDLCQQPHRDVVDGVPSSVCQCNQLCVPRCSKGAPNLDNRIGIRVKFVRAEIVV